MFRTLRAPITVQVEVTEKCDNVCRHCYNFFRHHDCKPKTLSTEQIDLLVKELKKNQVARVVITGGEPLTVPDITIYLVERLRKEGLGILFNSNLTLFDHEIGEKLLRAGVVSVMTSLIADQPELHDYITQRVGSWNKTTENIQLANSMGFRVMVNMVLTKWNIHRLAQTGNLVGSWGVAKFGATRACSPGPITPQFDKNLISIDELRTSLSILYELKERWGYQVDVFEHYPWCALSDVKKYRYLSRRKCTAGVTSASIGSSGDLRPCGHSSLTYGNVFEEGLQKPWSRMTAWREQKFTSVCQSCRHYRSCTGGCAVDALNSKNGVDHHMTDERDVLTIPEQENILPVAGGVSFGVVPDIILRDEIFGGTVTAKNSGAIFVDHRTFEILKVLRLRKTFTPDEVIEEFQVEAKPTREVLARLEIENLIKKGGGAI